MTSQILDKQAPNIVQRWKADRTVAISGLIE